MERIRRRRRRMIRLACTAVLLLVILAAVFLFQTRTIVVTGNVRHTGQEITEGISTDFLSKNTLWLLWRYRDGEIPDTLPYLSSIRMEMVSPMKLNVTVTEKEYVGYLDREQNIYFDGDGIVLEITDEVYEGIPVVTGAAIGDPVLYQKLPAESSAQLRTILSLTQLLSYQEPAAQEIRFGDNMDISVKIDGVEALLGQDEYLEEKVANLRAIMNSMEGSKTGILHMENFTGKNEQVSFRQSEETEAETTAGEDGTDGTGADAAGSGDGTDGTGADADGSGDGTDGTGADTAGSGNGADGSGAEGDATQESSGQPFMVFNSSGVLVYDAVVVNGQVVNSAGVPIEGCSVNEDGYVVDAYMNVIDPATGQLAQ